MSYAVVRAHIAVHNKRKRSAEARSDRNRRRFLRQCPGRSESTSYTHRIRSLASPAPHTVTACPHKTQPNDSRNNNFKTTQRNKRRRITGYVQWITLLGCTSTGSADQADSRQTHSQLPPATKLAQCAHQRSGETHAWQVAANTDGTIHVRVGRSQSHIRRAVEIIRNLQQSRVSVEKDDHGI